MTNRSYYKNIRIYKGYSLRELSNLTGIHYQQINRFEQGKFDLNTEEIQVYHDVLHFTEYFNPVSYEKALDIFKEFHGKVIKDDIDLKEYKEIILDQSTDINGKIVYSVIEYVISVLEKENVISKEVESLLSKYVIDNKYVKSVYMDYKGYHLFKLGLHMDAIKLFQELLASDLDPCVENMVRFHLGFVYKSMNYLMDALSVFTKAKENFLLENNLKRVFGCKLMLANILLRSRKHEDAEKEYIDCIVLGKDININESEIAKVYRNLASMMIKEMNYEKADFYLKNARAINENHPLVHVYDAWINYRMNRYNTAKRNIAKVKPLLEDEEALMILNFIESLCYLENHKPTLKLIQQAIKVYEYFKKSNDVDLVIFYLDIVIELLDRKKDYEKLVYYQNEKIILLEKRPLLQD